MKLTSLLITAYLFWGTVVQAELCSIATYDTKTIDITLPCVRIGNSQVSTKLNWINQTHLGPATSEGLYWKLTLEQVELSPCASNYPKCAILDNNLNFTIPVEINGVEQTAFLTRYPTMRGLYWRYDGLKANEDEQFAQVLNFMETELEENKVPGGAIAIITHGKLLNAAGVGVKHYGKTTPVNAETLFAAGSTAKMLTAAAVMTLVDEERIRTEAPITDYVPYFSLLTPHDPSSLSVHQILTHTAGLPDAGEDVCETDTEALSRWYRENTNMPLFTPPGLLFNYSNIGYSLLGLLVEEVSDLPFVEAMQQRIFEPLGMTRTTYDSSTVPTLDNYAIGHLEQNEEVQFISPSTYHCAYTRPAGGGGFYSTVIDMAHFVEMLLAQGQSVLSPAAVETMMTPHIKTYWLPGESSGFGLLVSDYKGIPVVYHGGSIGGFTATVWLVPKHNFGLVVMLNASHYFIDIIAQQALDTYFDLSDIAQPDFSTPPDRWDIYTGTYYDPYTFGEFEVFQDSEQRLWVGIMEDGEFETSELIQIAGDAFVFELDDDEYLMMNFVSNELGKVEYFVTRVGVGKRVEDSR